ncbi:hypothetical protein IE53DRAFT_371259 [Violaceomyces palustris]|uniref:Uncharacterized protein n=1 Tax=Violaceomyces palustris TaxID=1673888 RepID=A0ACD0NPJ5_9BASI|nr:hypothetical protein IE53DRAFT_371259 [Violaceomyces palustris]
MNPLQLFTLDGRQPRSADETKPKPEDLEQIMLGWNLTHHFKTTTELAFPSSEVIQLLHDHQSLILSNPEVVEVQRSDKDASIWIG